MPAKKSRRRPQTPKNARTLLIYLVTGWRLRVGLGCVAVVAALLMWATVVRLQAPISNTDLKHFDAIIVLGTSVDKDGNPSAMLLSRVIEGVHEYERGMAPRLILSGGREPNHFVEADIMARAARSEGIPDSAIIREDRSKDTIQNSCYSLQMMQSHGWHSAEIVTSDFHVPRAGMIFSRLPIQWRMHGAPPLQQTSTRHDVYMAWLESIKTVRYLLWANRTESCEP